MNRHVATLQLDYDIDKFPRIVATHKICMAQLIEVARGSGFQPSTTAFLVTAETYETLRDCPLFEPFHRMLFVQAEGPPHRADWVKGEWIERNHKDAYQEYAAFEDALIIDKRNPKEAAMLRFRRVGRIDMDDIKNTCKEE